MLNSSTCSSDPPVTVGDNLFFGKSGDCHGFVGMLDEVRIWKVARTPDQIDCNFNRSLDPSTPGLVGYWKFDEDPGEQNIYDSSLGDNDGFLGTATTADSHDPLRLPGGAPILAPLVKTFTGVSGGSWHVGSNWDPPGVPNTCSDVVISQGHPEIISENAASRSVIVGGGPNASSLRVENRTLTVERRFDLENNGALHLVGDVVVTGREFGQAGGQLDGSGTIHADVRHGGGRIRPGSSPGRITIDGDYSMTSGATLGLEIGNLTQGQRDTLTVTGTATLDGSLDLDLLGGITPSVGDLYGLVTAASRSGTFDAVTFGGGSSASLYHVTYTDTGFVVVLDSDFTHVTPGADPSGTNGSPSLTGVLGFRGRVVGEGVSVLDLAIARDVRLRLDLYDVRGRPIATLRDGMETAGVHQYALGTSSTGFALTSGIYFARLLIQDADRREVRMAKVPFVR